LSLPAQNQIEDAHQEFWRWIFRMKDGPNHPLKVSNNGSAQLQRGKLLIVAGSLPDNIQKNRLLQIPPSIEYVFVPAESCVYSDADRDGKGQELIDKANNDMADSEGKVLVNDKKQNIDRLPAHTFSPLLKIQECIDGAGKSGKGEGESCTKGNPPGDTEAAAACDYAIIPANALKSGDMIRIQGVGRAGLDQERGFIDVTYRMQ
jgi:hypothetical protein